MLTREIQLLTTLSLLALMWLVGGMGTGLHSWFGCCCEQTLLSECDADQSVEVGSPQDGQRDQSSGGAECPVCSLLSHYHVTPIVSTDLTLRDAIVARRCDGDQPTLLPSDFNWRRPRGPPAAASAS